MALSGKGAPRIDGGMLLAQIAKMGEIGVDGRGGRTRLALSEQDRTARDTLVEWMGEIGLSVRVDGIGNIFGLLETDAGGSFDGALMIGSHIDTVISAGAYDGVYGVLAGDWPLRGPSGVQAEGLPVPWQWLPSPTRRGSVSSPT